MFGVSNIITDKITEQLIWQPVWQRSIERWPPLSVKGACRILRSVKCPHTCLPSNSSLIFPFLDLCANESLVMTTRIEGNGTFQELWLVC